MTNQSLKSHSPNEFTQSLLDWYYKNSRQLPWRNTTDPYAIWISEVMLQQTQVATVIPYYHRFLSKYPTVMALATATEDDILKNWEGLGYYRRARLLHQGAKKIVTDFNGKFPNEHQKILDIPGIGSYIAGAVASIAFNLPTPAIDGNVIRVCTRQLAWSESHDTARSKQAIFTWVQKRFPNHHRGDFTQSLMELGALICTPRQPKCNECPVNLYCCGKSNPEMYPVKKGTKVLPVEQRLILIVNWNGRRLLLKRPPKGLMAGFWEYPNLLVSEETNLLKLGSDWSKIELGEALEFHFLKNTAHVYTHLRWELKIFTAEWLNNTPPLTPANGEWFLPEKEAALPRVAFVRKLL